MVDSPLDTLGQRLAAARRLAGISGRELGRLAGISETFPSMIESGERPRVEAHCVGRLADVLGVTCDWLISGKGRLPNQAEVAQAVERSRGISAADDASAGAEG